MPQYNIHNLRIDPAVFQHPADKAATDLIRKSGYFQKALSYISEKSLETVMFSYNRSTYAEITKDVSPTIHTMICEAEEMFGAENRMSVFLERTYALTAMLSGIKRPYLMLSSEFLRQMDEKMLWGVIASEASGIASGFNTIKFVEQLCSVSGGLISPLIAAPLNLLFENWHKYAQFSFDRAALLATGDLNVTMQTILLGEAPIEALEQIDFADPENSYMKQCREFLDCGDKVMDRIRDAKSVLNTWLFYASRYMDLFRFYQSDYYDLLEEYQQV